MQSRAELQERYDILGGYLRGELAEIEVEKGKCQRQNLRRQKKIKND